MRNIAFKKHQTVSNGSHHHGRLPCCIAWAALSIQLQSRLPSVSQMINAELAAIHCRIPARVQVQDRCDRAGRHRVRSICVAHCNASSVSHVSLHNEFLLPQFGKRFQTAVHSLTIACSIARVHGQLNGWLPAHIVAPHRQI